MISVLRFEKQLAERGDLPKSIAYTNPNTGAPVVAIVVTWVLAVGLTLSGTFEQLLVLGVVARFAQYIPTTLAVLVLRARKNHSTTPEYTIPFGPLIPSVTLCLCAWLLYNADPKKLQMGGIALLVGAFLYLLKKLNASKSSPST